MPTPRIRNALVLGGGFAGTLAAYVLSQVADTVTVVDRDRFADEPTDRKGTPHARHTHALVSGGARALADLMPGLIDSLLAKGAQRIGLPDRYLALTPYGWFHRRPGTQYIIGSSRRLLEWTIRSRLPDGDQLRFVEATDVLGLTGSSAAVTGARCRDRATGEVIELSADFVVDTTGRSSQAVDWLTELGLPPVHQVTVDPGIFYTTRIFRAPDEATQDFPAVNIQANPALTTRSRRSGVLIPIEDGQWTVTLSGAPGSQPTLDEEGQRAFAASLPDPTIAKLIAAAEPLGPAFGFRAHANRRRYFERLPQWPRGLVVMGDAYATFNPVYGHGLTVAARAAIALRDGLAQHGADGTQQIQQSIAAAADDAWTMATTQDLRFPQTDCPRPGRAARLQYAFQDWLGRKAMNNPTIAEAQIDVFTLSAPATNLLRPSILLKALRTPHKDGLNTPPFSDEELRVLDPTPS
ncbi:FAD-dependent monooxygenase [Crossiella sp. SN42]|uniref:FAD-dependent oxidoreductase n=1 Tax=Crossiella sp. SN42 TaxID=2944808 RepID=UPI00207C4DFE|nr:FAD-dependent monooxygenase [Crossiella sp. SN42]MCO1575176.1 FAD-dependent monooxygenase [Crossiella sp. SN42]